MKFSEANKLYRQGEYEQAASYYVESLHVRKDFKPCYINLALALRKIKNKASCDKLLKKALSILNPGRVEDVLDNVKKSKLVNAKWYVLEHGEWLPEKVDPVLHYLVVGWQLGLSPCKRFDNNFYLKNNKNQLLAGESPLLHYLYKGKDLGNEIKDRESSGTADLAVQLWNGHSISALKALEAVYSDEKSTEVSRWWAMWHTARWIYFCGEIENALAFSDRMQELKTANEGRKETVYLKYFCLLSLNRIDEAYQTLANFIHHNRGDADAQLALANSILNDTDRVETINKAFALHGFSGIKRIDDAAPLGIDNVIGMPAPKIEGEKKVSIIMPIYNASKQIHIAIESLLAQTYENIEIIAVDDCSPDDTFQVLKEFERRDSRVRAIQPPQNGGAYAARNYGLSFATGDLLTTHDSDDWSHPQKIATQVAYLESNPDVMGCSVYWIRARRNLNFTQNWRPNSSLTHWSQSSFMFRRNVLDAIGEWDHVRIGGDTEYIWRMQAKFGKKSFAKIYENTPLAFALDEESSLTRTKATHVRTVYFGLRHIYREICAWWHKTGKHLNIKNAKEKRIFPAPRSMFDRSNDPLVFDLVVAGDYSRVIDCEKVKKLTQMSQSKKIALFHWPNFEQRPAPLNDLYFEMLLEENIEPVVMGQTVKSTLFKIADKNLLNYPLDGSPEWIEFEEWLILE